MKTFRFYFYSVFAVASLAPKLPPSPLPLISSHPNAPFLIAYKFLPFARFLPIFYTPNTCTSLHTTARTKPCKEKRRHLFSDQTSNKSNKPRKFKQNARKKKKEKGHKTISSHVYHHSSSLSESFPSITNLRPSCYETHREEN